MTGAGSRVAGWLADLLVCPRDLAPLQEQEATLVCEHGHVYPVVRGIPVLLRDDVRATQEHIVARSRLLAESEARPAAHPAEGIHPFVQDALAATCGNLYIGAATPTYPIPQLRMSPGNGRTLIDIGCNWGRWTVAASRAGYRAIGTDPNLEALLVAQMVVERLGATAQFVCCDARYLPFKNDSVYACFSYSVLQHLSIEDATAAIREIGRVLRMGGEALVQMANRVGARSFIVQAKRGFRTPREFEVRYWNVDELLRVFEHEVGRSHLEVDGFFGLGVQPTDAQFLSGWRRTQIQVSEFLRGFASHVHPLARVADSVYIRSTAV